MAFIEEVGEEPTTRRDLAFSFNRPNTEGAAGYITSDWKRHMGQALMMREELTGILFVHRKRSCSQG